MIRSVSALWPFLPLPVAVALWSRLRGASWPTTGARILLSGAAVFIFVYAILPPVATGWSLTSFRFFPTLIPFSTIRSYLAHGLMWPEIEQLLGNIALFVPLGFALPMAFQRARRALVTIGIAVAVSLGAEVAQTIIPVHGPDIDDVILNTLGGAVGYAGFALSRVLVRVSRGAPARVGRPPRSPGASPAPPPRSAS